VVINIRKHRLVAAIIFLALLIIFVINITDCGENKKSQPDTGKSIVCGEFLSWNEVKSLFPLKSEANLIDLQTGLQFRVQRRGGTYHADVQPLTADDTAVMKAIYNNKWTWRRRAIIVGLDDGKMIAASMNGMPHGLGSIAGNNFNGHFCVHFKDSKTHCSSKIDTAHQLMIWKSANLLQSKLASLNASQTVELLFIAIGQGDIETVSHLIDFGKGNSLVLLRMEIVEKLRINRIVPLENDSFLVDVCVVYQGLTSEYNHHIQTHTVKTDSGWKINPECLTQLLDHTAAAVKTEPFDDAMEEDWEETEVSS